MNSFLLWQLSARNYCSSRFMVSYSILTAMRSLASVLINSFISSIDILEKSCDTGLFGEADTIGSVFVSQRDASFKRLKLPALRAKVVATAALTTPGLSPAFSFVPGNSFENGANSLSNPGTRFCPERRTRGVLAALGGKLFVSFRYLLTGDLLVHLPELPLVVQVYCLLDRADGVAQISI